jgi:hypothetical protein
MIRSLQLYKEEHGGDTLVIGPNNLPVVPYYDVMYKKIKFTEPKIYASK